jgi:2-isopropylmalate synthase
MPDEYGDQMARLKQAIPELGDTVLLSTHCHNDLGLAVANSLAAIRAGADQVEVTLNGIGERAGNAALEEIVMSLKVRKDFWDVETGVNAEYLYPTSRLLQNITGLVTPRNKPIFGDNVFSHESGIHQHGVLKNRETYEIMNPDHIGRSRETLVMGRHSGKHALKEKLEQYNIVLKDDQMDSLYVKFTEIADKKKEVYDEDLFTLVSGVLGDLPAGWRLESFQTWTGNNVIPSATVQMKKAGEISLGTQAGDGPVDAVFKSIDQCTGTKGRLTEYVIQAVGSGKDAQGQVKLQVDFGGVLADGKASSTDIIEASALAYINALNRKEMMGENGAKSEHPQYQS